MFKFLNDLKFNWVEPHNEEAAIDGFWMFDAASHPHDQWQAISAQSNPRYYTTWGIQQLIEQWYKNILECNAPPFNVLTRTNPDYEERLFDEACRLETNYDLDAYRQALDNMIDFASDQIGQQVVCMGHKNFERYDIMKARYMNWRSHFDKAFS